MVTFIDAREACSSFDVVLGSFVTSCMSCHCALGGILEGFSWEGFPFGDNVCHCGSLESKSLYNS